MVQTRGFEPPRDCSHYPLKVARLPIPPRLLNTRRINYNKVFPEFKFAVSGDKPYHVCSMDSLILRSLIIALVEYAFALYVWRNGRLLKKSVTFFLIFLASYQFGEFLFFITGEKFFVHLAAISATFLPPLGVYFLERISGRKYLSRNGYRSYKLCNVFTSVYRCCSSAKYVWCEI